MVKELGENVDKNGKVFSFDVNKLFKLKHIQLKVVMHNNNKYLQVLGNQSENFDKDMGEVKDEDLNELVRPMLMIFRFSE